MSVLGRGSAIGVVLGRPRPDAIRGGRRREALVAGGGHSHPRDSPRDSPPRATTSGARRLHRPGVRIPGRACGPVRDRAGADARRPDHGATRNRSDCFRTPRPASPAELGPARRGEAPPTPRCAVAGRPLLSGPGTQDPAAEPARTGARWLCPRAGRGFRRGVERVIGAGGGRKKPRGRPSASPRGARSGFRKHTSGDDARRIHGWLAAPNSLVVRLGDEIPQPEPRPCG